MAFNGIEIDMLSLGDADCILVTEWDDDLPTYVLIDGGYAKDVPAITAFLASRDALSIDHMICSHLHDDHASGLLRIVENGKVEIGTAWVHRPEQYVDMAKVNKALKKTANLKESRVITASLETERKLVAELEIQDIDVYQPFEGQQIGFLTVRGPSEEYYAKLVQDFEDADRLVELNAAAEMQKAARDYSELFEGRAAAAQVLPPDACPYTDPENRASTILSAQNGEKVLLFTADAGVESLRLVEKYPDLAKCWWMQVPHHGSINNVNQNLVDFFRPRIAFASAIGNGKHPNPAVVAGYKKRGTKVYSTHHPHGRHLRYHVGEVPERAGYTTAEPL